LDKPKHSHFCTNIIQIFIIAKATTSVSFRSMSGVFEVFGTCIKEGISTPSFSTGMLWIKKVGYYQLNQAKEIADDWILILDESIGIGQEKLLVVLGIRKSKIDFTHPLKIQDMEPIVVKSKKTWTGEDISKELEFCKEKVGNIIYATTDGGSTLKKGLRTSNIPHVYDLTHGIAIMLEKLYKNDPEFKEFTHTMGQMRLKLCCSKHAHIIPPNQRSKSRFLNIDILSCWCDKVLVALEKNNLSETERELLQWVLDKKEFVNEMHLIVNVIEKLSITLKNYGLNSKTVKKSKQILQSCCSTAKQTQFKKLFEEYLTYNTALLNKKMCTLLCSSDIIETTFGKFKNELSKNPMSGITDMALIIPAFTSSFIKDDIKKAIDNCTKKMIKQWAEINLCDSLSVKRYIALN